MYVRGSFQLYVWACSSCLKNKNLIWSFMYLFCPEIGEIIPLRLLTHVGFFRQNGLILSEVFLYMERSKNHEKIITVQKNSPS